MKSKDVFAGSPIARRELYRLHSDIQLNRKDVAFEKAFEKESHATSTKPEDTFLLPHISTIHTEHNLTIVKGEKYLYLKHRSYITCLRSTMFHKTEKLMTSLQRLQ